jgi:hypothetical protein
VNTSPNPLATEFLTRFFCAPGNQILLRDIDNPRSKVSALQPLVNEVRKAAWCPTVLPRRNEKGELIWYGLAPDEQQLRVIAERVTAFVGPSYSSFRGELVSFEPADDLERSVLDFSAGRAFRFTGDSKAIWKAVLMMRAVMNRSPRRRTIEARTVDLILKDFYSYINAGDRHGAELAIAALRQNGCLDNLNLLFLKAQLLGELRAWGELLEMEELADLLAVRRPKLVNSLLIQAVYSHHLAAFEATSDIHGAAEVFRSTVAKEYAALLNIRTGFQRPAELKFFMIAAVAGEPADPVTRDRILSASGIDSATAEYLRQLATLLPTQSPVSGSPTVEAATDLLRQSKYDVALQVAIALPSIPEAGEILLRSAAELNSLDASRAASDRFRSYPEEVKLLVLRSWLNQAAWSRLTLYDSPPTSVQVPSTPVPTSWLEWFDALYQEPLPKRIAEIARLGAAEWDLNDVVGSPGGVNGFVTFLTRTRSVQQDEALQSTLPLLFRAVERLDESVRSLFIRLIHEMHTLVLLTDVPSDGDLDLHNDLVRALITWGKAEFKSVIAECVDLWRRVQSASRCEWVSELLDLLLAHGGNPPVCLQNFAAAVFSFATQNARRLDADLLAFLRQLAQELGLTFVLSGDGDEERHQTPRLDPLRDTTILLYSLQPNVPKRVQRLIEADSPDIKVHISEDLAGSARLKTMVKHANLLVLATRAATHAATEFIELHKKRDAVILRPPGKGTLAMWREIVSYANADLRKRA